MADEDSQASSTGASPSTGESKAQEQARLRRERRNAKIQSGGSARLNKITSMAGRPAAAEAELGRPASTPTSRQASQSHPTSETPSSPQPATRGNDDPAEVDITQMFNQPPPIDGTIDGITAEQQQQLLQQLLRAAGPPPSDSPQQQQQQQQSPSPQDDPLFQMMQQLLGSAPGGDPHDAQPAPGLSAGAGVASGLASMFGAQPQPPDTRSNTVWRVVHAATALLIGLYAAWASPFFAGTPAALLLPRTGGASDHEAPEATPALPLLFYLFTTAELVLQTSRYFLDGGALPAGLAGGVLGGLGRMLPQPWGGYAKMLARYAGIYSTVVSDAMVVVFVVGAMAWWRGVGIS